MNALQHLSRNVFVYVYVWLNPVMLYGLKMARKSVILREKKKKKKRYPQKTITGSNTRNNQEKNQIDLLTLIWYW